MNSKFSIVKDRDFYKQITVIMIPIVLQQAINMGVNMMDTFMLGKLGEAQISASSLANSFYNLYTVLCMGINGGCSVLAAQYWGKGDKEKVRESFTLAVYLSVASAFLFSLATAFFPGQIMRIYTPEEDVIAYGKLYLRYTTFTYFFHGTAMVVAFMMRSVKKPKLGLYVSIVSFFVNVFANWVFIFGKLGAPRMEIAGAALGTLIARISEFIVTFGYVLFLDESVGLRIKHVFRLPTKELFYNFRRLGFSALISDCLIGIGNTMISMVLGRMGAAVVAANAVCQVIDRLLTVVVSGTSNAASIITGQTIGRGELEKARVQGDTFYVLGLGIGIFNCLMVMTFGRLTLGLYDLEASTVEIAKGIMIAYAVGSFFHTTQSVMTKGVLRGGGDTRFLLVADVLFLWILSVPLGYLVGVVLQGPAWLTVTCLHSDWIVKSFWCLGRLKSGKWIRETEHLPKK